MKSSPAVATSTSTPRCSRSIGSTSRGAFSAARMDQPRSTPRHRLAGGASSRSDLSVHPAQIASRIDEASPQVLEFDLALVSHFLILYSAHLSFDVYLAAVRELCRVASAVRIFPILTLAREPSPARRQHDVSLHALRALAARHVAAVGEVARSLLPRGALALGRIVASLLFGVSPADPSILVAAGATMILITIAAVGVPARRAMSVDPAVVLRGD